MNASAIKRILNGIDIDYSGTAQIPQLRTILLTSNQGIDSRRDFITFDFTNNLIKIKKYQPTLAAGRIGNCYFGDETHTWIVGNVSTFYAKHRKYDYPIANNECTLFTVNKETGKIINTYKIFEAGLNFIKTNEKIEFNSKTEYICYSTSEDFGSMVQDELDKSLFLKYTPKTKNTYDIYLDMNQIVGFEFISERVGNS